MSEEAWLGESAQVLEELAGPRVGSGRGVGSTKGRGTARDREADSSRRKAHRIGPAQRNASSQDAACRHNPESEKSALIQRRGDVPGRSLLSSVGDPGNPGDPSKANPCLPNRSLRRLPTSIRDLPLGTACGGRTARLMAVQRNGAHRDRGLGDGAQGRPSLSEICLGQSFVDKAAVALVWTAIPYRTE